MDCVLCPHNCSFKVPFKPAEMPYKVKWNWNVKIHTWLFKEVFFSWLFHWTHILPSPFCNSGASLVKRSGVVVLVLLLSWPPGTLHVIEDEQGKYGRKIIGYSLPLFDLTGVWGLWSVSCSEWPDLKLWSHVSPVYPLSDTSGACMYKYLMSICQKM